jgi:glyoxylase-like metal-dependent hydrolase (beta-lactamase superfamily II)
MNSGTHRFNVGAFQCTAIRDGASSYPVAMFLTNITKQHHPSAEQVELPYTCLFIDTGRNRVLIDTGLGSAPAGMLLEHLHAEGIEPGQIDTVILSHAHPDHIGGVLCEDGSLTFPRARYAMFKKEWDYWQPPPTLDELSLDAGFRQMILASATKALPAIAGRVDMLAEPAEGAAVEIVPGIGARAAFGHTPGHMAVEITSNGSTLMFVADALILPLNFEFPEAIGLTDHQPESILATRLRILEEVSARGLLIGASHLPFPGLGHAVRDKSRWRWRPL